MRRLVVCAALVAGCGRIGFSTDSTDAVPTADAVPAVCFLGANKQISNAVGRSESPSIVWNDAGFGIAWVDTRDGNAEIYIAVLDPDGVSSGEVRVTTTSEASGAPSLAWSGTSFGLMWVETLTGNQFQMMFQQVGAAGAPIGAPTPHGAPFTSNYVPSRSLRWLGGSYVLAWQAVAGGNDEIFVARLNETGAPLTSDIQETVAAGGSGFPTVTSTGAELGLAWNDDRDAQNEVYFMRLTGGGQKVTGDVRVTDAPGSSFAPTLEWTGAHFLATWWDDRSGTSEIYLAALGAEGGRIGSEIRLNPDQYGQVGIARWSGSSLGIVWADFRNELLEPYFGRVDADGRKLGDDVRVSSSGVEMDLNGHDVAANATRFAIAWSDARTGDAEVYVAVATCQ